MYRGHVSDAHAPCSAVSNTRLHEDKRAWCSSGCSVVGRDSGKESESIDLSTWRASKWERPNDKLGTLLSGTLEVSDDIGKPGALVFTYTGPDPPANKPQSARVCPPTPIEQTPVIRPNVWPRRMTELALS